MAYLGKGLVGVLNESKAVDTMTGDGSDTTLTLSRTPGSVNNVEVYMDGVFQTPGVEYTLSGNTVSFSSAPENGTMIIALMGNDSSIIEPNDASISGTKIAGAVVTDAKIAGMAANKLSGALPAVDGSALTNMPSGVTKNASDPAIDTNPSGGVGTIWANTTSGEMYVLTDATAGENVWYNVGGGTGDVQSYSFQGTISGYTAGGSGGSNVIDKFSFASDGNAADVGDITVGRYGASGSSSATHGYSCGGVGGGYRDIIDKFSFTSDGNATDVGNLVGATSSPTGQSSEANGYSSGGATASYSTVINKYATASDANATDAGDLTSSQFQGAGQSSATHGYSSGGSPAPKDIISKFTFASDANATDVGDLTQGRWEGLGGQSSTTHGYTTGGFISGALNTMDKFTFASDANATDVGDLTVARYGPTGQSSTVSGYTSGGNSSNIIDKFSFASDGNATDVGDITVARNTVAGTQN